MNNGAKYGIIGVIIAIVIGIIAINASLDTTESDVVDTPDPTTTTSMQDAPKDVSDIMEVEVGVLIPVTGDLSSYGADNKVGYELALEKFNEHLAENDAEWRMKLVIEDTQTDPIIALEKTQSLDAKGIKYILGPASSSEIRNMMSYANSNDMLIVSPSSTSPKLAIEDDNIFRFISDDSIQGEVLATLFDQQDIKAIVAIYRGDIWGDGMFENTKKFFEQKGGFVAESIRYSPEITTFSTEASVLSKSVDTLLEDYELDEIGIFVASFDEAAILFNSASSYDNLRSVQWVGSEGVTASHAITSDTQSSEFASNTNLLSIQFSAAENPIYHQVRDDYREITGDVPGNNYVFSAYDSLWGLGLAMDEVGFEYKNVKEQLPESVEQYVGALGDIYFNPAGDLAITDYEFLIVDNSKWVPSLKYDSAADTFTEY